MSNKWTNVLQEVAASATNRHTTLRWRKADPEYLLGEARVIIAESGFQGSKTKAAEVLALVMRMIGDKPDMFTYNETRDSAIFHTARLGEMLHMRVGGLSKSEEKAQNFVRVWMTTDAETFAKNHLIKIIRFCYRDGITVPVDALLHVLYTWDYNKSAVVARIAQEFFIRHRKNNTQKGAKK